MHYPHPLAHTHTPTHSLAYIQVVRDLGRTTRILLCTPTSTHPHTHTLTHSHTHELTHSRTHTLTNSHTHALKYSLTHTLPHFHTQHTHTLTHSHTGSEWCKDTCAVIWWIASNSHTRTNLILSLSHKREYQWDLCTSKETYRRDE